MDRAWKVVREDLSDGSAAWNVVNADEGITLKGGSNRASALAVCEHLNLYIAYVEVDEKTREDIAEEEARLQAMADQSRGQ